MRSTVAHRPPAKRDALLLVQDAGGTVSNVNDFLFLCSSSPLFTLMCRTTFSAHTHSRNTLCAAGSLWRRILGIYLQRCQIQLSVLCAPTAATILLSIAMVTDTRTENYPPIVV